MDENKQIKKNNQIEQMAKDMFFNTFCPHDLCENCYFKEKCRQRTFAKNLVNQGYRKQSDTVREFVQKLKSDFDNDKGNLYVISEERLNELAKEYGVEVNKTNDQTGN